MFAKNPDRSNVNEMAKSIAERLSEYTQFKSHAHHISREEAQEIGLHVDDLEADQQFKDLVLSLCHATTHTFNGAAAVKIIEKQNGQSFIKLQKVAVQIPQPQLVPHQEPDPSE